MSCISIEKVLSLKLKIVQLKLRPILTKREQKMAPIAPSAFVITLMTRSSTIVKKLFSL